MLRCSAILLLCLGVYPMAGLASQPLALPDDLKPRVVVMTDVGGDPDDEQSIVRFLLYSCDLHVEGLLTGFGHGHDKNTRPDLLRKAVAAYGEVVGNLLQHRRDYPSADHLMGLIKDGHNGDPHTVGEGMDSEASEWIIPVLDSPDPRPVWFTIWGGPRELAQALWKLSQSRSAQELAAVKAKIRVHSIADQDRTAGWVKEHHPDTFWIYSSCFRGMWRGEPAEPVSPEWLMQNVLQDHGALGPVYPPKASGKEGVKEGDTPSFLYVLPNGLSDPEHPEWGGWGGRFRPSGRGDEYVDAADTWSGRTHPDDTIARWREAYQNAFEARMDWCVKPFDGANHEPKAVINGDRSLQVLHVKADPTDQVTLSAAGSTDPDGDGLSYRWWVYREAGNFRGSVPLQGADTRKCLVEVPQEASGCELHVILDVTDDGSPPLASYRRVVIEVSGERGDTNQPITSLPGPPTETGPWAFHRGVNLNGPPLAIDGHNWEGDGAPDFECTDRAVSAPDVPLIPPTDEVRAQMIRAFRWSREVSATMRNVPTGRYAVYAYIWEDNNPETFSISLNGQEVAPDVYSGMQGEWQRLGPWYVDVTEGAVELASRGGAANFSGIEVWRRVAT